MTLFYKNVLPKSFGFSGPYYLILIIPNLRKLCCELVIHINVTVSLINNRMGRGCCRAWGHLGSKVWVLTIVVLEVNPELDSIRAKHRHARSALFSRLVLLYDAQFNTF